MYGGEGGTLRAKDTYIVSTARYCCCNRSAGEHSSTIALSVAAGGGQWPIFQSSYAPYRSDNVLFSSHNALRHGRLHLIISPLLQQSLSRWVIIAGMKKNSLPVFRVLRFVSFDFGRGSRLYCGGGRRLFGRIVFQFRIGGSKAREILTAMLLLLIYWYLTYWQPSFSDLYFTTRPELENYTTFRKVENSSVFKCLNLQIYIIRPYVSKSSHEVVNLARREVTVFPCPGPEVNYTVTYEDTSMVLLYCTPYISFVFCII